MLGFSCPTGNPVVERLASPRCGGNNRDQWQTIPFRSFTFSINIRLKAAEYCMRDGSFRLDQLSGNGSVDSSAKETGLS